MARRTERSGDDPAGRRGNPPQRWQEVPIEECGEPLVAVEQADGLKVRAAYHEQGLPGSNPTLHVREGVLERLVEASSKLPPGLELLLLDAWRPFELQAALFDRAVDQGIDASEAPTYVSVPSTDPDCPPPHLTGGAVDLTLIDRDGVELDMGTQFDEFTPASAADAGLPSHGDAHAKPWRANRESLSHAMISSGFTPYSEEWWHFDFGNQFWGLQERRPAIYGPASLDGH